jgi:hypothetical protein
MSYECYVCNDGQYGLVDGVCPSCGKRFGKDGSDVKEKLDVREIASMKIPREYRGVEWSSEELVADKRLLADNRKFNAYVEQLERVHELCKNGKQVPMSAIFVSPPGFSKMVWAYSCLQLAMKNNYKVFPVLDTQQMKRFLTICQEKPNNKFFKENDFNFDYEDFLTADILFLTVSKGYMRRGAWEVILQVIDERGRMDRPTLVISSVSISEFCGFDSFGRFNQSFDTSGRLLGYRNPVFVQLSDSTMVGTVRDI